MKELAKEPALRVAEKLPVVNHRVIVVCRESRCLGYLDDQHIWRDDARSNELKDVVGWMEFSDMLSDQHPSLHPPPRPPAATSPSMRRSSESPTELHVRE